MPEQYLNLNKKISKNKINLKKFYFFYRDYICPYNYIYTLNTGDIIEVVFEKNNFPHLLGLHKFNKVSSINKAEEILLEICEENLTTQFLKQTEPHIFNKPLILDRLMFFPTLKTLLETSKNIIKFDPTRCIPTSIEADFFLFSEEIKITIFLAIREIKSEEKKIICCPVSFLVDRHNQYQKEKHQHIDIINLKILKKTESPHS